MAISCHTDECVITDIGESTNNHVSGTANQRTPCVIVGLAPNLGKDTRAAEPFVCLLDGIENLRRNFVIRGVAVPFVNAERNNGWRTCMVIRKSELNECGRWTGSQRRNVEVTGSAEARHAFGSPPNIPHSPCHSPRHPRSRACGSVYQMSRRAPKSEASPLASQAPPIPPPPSCFPAFLIQIPPFKSTPPWYHPPTPQTNILASPNVPP